jgi:hypothetical protein
MDVVPLIVAVSIVLSFGGYSAYKTSRTYNRMKDMKEVSPNAPLLVAGVPTIADMGKAKRSVLE